ncbi:ProQ/FINO family protein, partial [Salmonella enterica]|uniref:ProQ/FINO family protein n=1 Tax=Salmonella enterica TaxID=28901 RepID=UPI001D03CBFB
KVKALFPLLRAEEGGFRPLKIGITRDVIDFLAQNPGAGLTLPEWQCAVRIITRRWKYLERISVPGALRYGIDGLPAGVVSEHEAQHARAFLASKLARKNESNGGNNIRAEKEGSC